MGIEIERKFLVNGDGWRKGPAGRRMRQGYLCVGPPVAVRVRIDGDRAILNIKKATLDIKRAEFEYPVPLDEGEALIDGLTTGQPIHKTRYLREYAGHTWEIDEFHGANAGLIVAEIELESEDEAFEIPPWAGPEVSDDPRYLNAYLADHPYTSW